MKLPPPLSQVLARNNTGNFNPATDTLNLVNPPFRDTVTLLPNGFVYLRFLATSPGACIALAAYQCL